MTLFSKLSDLSRIFLVGRAILNLARIHAGVFVRFPCVALCPSSFSLTILTVSTSKECSNSVDGAPACGLKLTLISQ